MLWPLVHLISSLVKSWVNSFKLGEKNKWQNLLDQDVEKMITNEFKKEMKELGYT